MKQKAINQKFVKLKTLSAALLGASISTSAFATDFSVSVTNLTQGIYFTPLLIAAHDSDNRLFSSGTAASASLQAMAEGGDISGLVTDLTPSGAEIVENPAAGLLGPGMNATAALNTDSTPENAYLSVVAMMLPTNDGFIGLNAVEIPTEPGTYTYNVNAYDAGTEGNDEIRGSGAPGEAGFPAPGPVDVASGFNGTGFTTASEDFVHIHRNVIGDTDANGGVSDIDATVHRWLNPVAKVTITVN